MTMKAGERVRAGELAIVLVLMFFGVAGSIPGIAPNQANEMTGAAATSLQTAVGIGSQLLVNGMIVALLVVARRTLAGCRNLLSPALALPLVALGSILWSQQPALTARRAVPFALAAAFGIFIATAVPQRRLLRLLQIAFLLLAAWSAVLAVGFPATGLDASTGHSGDWQGVFTQKNACGRAMVFALASVLACGGLSISRLMMLAVFCAELVLSGSRGAWLLGFCIVCAMLALRWSSMLDRKLRAAMLLLVVVSAVAGVTAAFSAFADLASLLGRDPTLTGRTAIWHEVWIAIKQRPALGYGFSAFWKGLQGPSWSVIVALRFVLFHAHNGFLEIWLELGLVGLLVFAGSYMRAVLLLLPEILAGNFQEAAWPFSVLLLTLLYNLDENSFLSFNGLFFVLYTAAITRVELLARDRRHVRRLLLSAVSAKPVPWLVSSQQEPSTASAAIAALPLPGQPFLTTARSSWL